MKIIQALLVVVLVTICVTADAVDRQTIHQLKKGTHRSRVHAHQDGDGDGSAKNGNGGNNNNWSWPTNDKDGDTGGSNEGPLPSVSKTIQPVTDWVNDFMKKAGLAGEEAGSANPVEEAMEMERPIIERVEEEQRKEQEYMAANHADILDRIKKAEAHAIATDLEAKQSATNAETEALDAKAQLAALGANACDMCEEEKTAKAAGEAASDASANKGGEGEGEAKKE